MLDAAPAFDNSIVEDLRQRNPLCSKASTGGMAKSFHECYCGLALGKGPDDLCAGSLGASALIVAIARGFGSLAQLMFDHGGDFSITAFGGDYCAALLAASTRGEVELVP